MTFERLYIIAEAGVNHDGDLELALQLVDVAAEAGADAVKFQTFVAVEAATSDAPKADYQQRLTPQSECQLAMLQRLQLSDEAHFALLRRCEERDIEFLSSPFDVASVDFLTGGLGLRRLKIGSGEIVNGPLLLAAAERGAEVILSTGMSDMSEVEDALGVLAFGYLGIGNPSQAAFRDAFRLEAGQAAIKSKVSLLHCTSEYPAPVEEANLLAIDSLRNTFGLPVGLSDHSLGQEVALAAVALGATIIEKHFTLDKKRPGPDHAASLEPTELGALVRSLRWVEAALGDGVKRPQPSELSNRAIIRKVLVAKRAIAKGELLKPEMIGFKRVGHGRSPMAYWDILYSSAKRDFSPNEPLE
jgi:N-acetylneuraminate synthase